MITVVPAAQTAALVTLGILATAAIVFAALALIFWRRGTPGPKWLLRTLQTVAVLATLMVAMLAAG